MPPRTWNKEIQKASSALDVSVECAGKRDNWVDEGLGKEFGVAESFQCYISQAIVI